MNKIGDVGMNILGEILIIISSSVISIEGGCAVLHQTTLLNNKHYYMEIITYD